MDESTSVVLHEQPMNPTNQPVSFYGDNSRNTDGALLAAVASKDYYAPALDGVSANGIACARGEIGDLKGLVKDVGANVRADIGDTKMVIKDGESNIRSDVRQEGQEGVSATKDVGILVRDAECHVVNKLGDVECKVIKENSDQTLYITNQLSVIREQGIRGEYETKLSREQTIKEVNEKAQYNADRLHDKLDRKFERNEDKLQALKDFDAEKFCDLQKQIQHCCCDQELANATQTGLLNIIANALNVGGLGVTSHK